jgi:hypothetical protein
VGRYFRYTDNGGFFDIKDQKNLMVGNEKHWGVELILNATLTVDSKISKGISVLLNFRI